MSMWIVERMELATAGPVGGVYPVHLVMRDTDTFGSRKYELRNISAADYPSNPNAILMILQTDGYTPNDFGLPME